MTGGKERGFVLVTALLLLSVLTTLGTAAVLQGTADLRICGNHLAGIQARYAAEAGVNVAAAVFLRNPEAFLEKRTAREMGLPTARPATPHLRNKGAYWFPSITYDPADPPAWVDIRCLGSVLDTNSLGDITVRMGAAYDSRFDCAAFGEEWVHMGGRTYTDSFISVLSPWTAEGGRERGDIATNGTRPGAITLAGQAKVYGSAAIGAKGYTDEGIRLLGRIVEITGERKVAVAPKDTTAVALPHRCTSLALTPSMTIPGGIYRLSGMKSTGGTNILIGGDVTLIVDRDLFTAGKTKIRVPPGSSLALYVAGDMILSGGEIVNETEIPANVRIYGTSACRRVSLAGGSALHAAIYAPQADIRISGGTELFGAAVGRTVDVQGESSIHYDEALRDADGGTALTALVTLWWRDNPA
jgi:hypothetical protein